MMTYASYPTQIHYKLQTSLCSMVLLNLESNHHNTIMHLSMEMGARPAPNRSLVGSPWPYTIQILHPPASTGNTTCVHCFLSFFPFIRPYHIISSHDGGGMKLRKTHCSCARACHSARCTWAMLWAASRASEALRCCIHLTAASKTDNTCTISCVRLAGPDVPASVISLTYSA